jgi:hypothetical protein
MTHESTNGDSGGLSRVSRRTAMLTLASTTVVAPSIIPAAAAAAAAAEPDPIFEAIKAHEDAELACNAACREIDRLLKAADDAGFPTKSKF